MGGYLQCARLLTTLRVNLDPSGTSSEKMTPNSRQEAPAIRSNVLPQISYLAARFDLLEEVFAHYGQFGQLMLRQAVFGSDFPKNKRARVKR